MSLAMESEVVTTSNFDWINLEPSTSCQLTATCSAEELQRTKGG
jgi:hypothetical protein